MDISIISPDLSHNCLGRAYVLAQLLERNYKVEIVGPKFQQTIWEPIRNEYEYKGVQTSQRLYNFLRDVPRILDEISGDIIYASKPRMESYGVGLLQHLNKDHPIILDIDDWEVGLIHDNNHFPAMTYIKRAPRILNVNSIHLKRIFQSLTQFADAMTVSNHFLRKRFGGTIIPHARDHREFKPARHDKSDVRDELGLPQNKFIALFSGTPRPYKGVLDLVKAVNGMDDEEVLGLIVGASESEFVDRIRRMSGPFVQIEGMKPFSHLPRWIAASDIIVIPQRKTLATVGQLPAKLFDAMAMGKPIIATEVGDLPRVLGDTGLIIQPERPDELRKAIIQLKLDGERRQKLGRMARQRFKEHYSYDALAPVIANVVSNVKDKSI